MCVYVCAHVCMDVCMCMYMCMCMCVNMCMSACACVYVCDCVRVCTCVFVYVHVYMCLSRDSFNSQRRLCQVQFPCFCPLRTQNLFSELSETRWDQAWTGTFLP